MGKRRRKLSCGRYVAEYLYSRVTRYDCPKARAEKRHHTSQVQQALNDKNALIYNAAVIAGTFIDEPTSVFACLTLDDDHYPFSDKAGESWSKIHKLLDNYIARLQRLAKRRGSALAYGWSPGKGDYGRYHIHILIKGLSREDVVTVWGLGDVKAYHLYKDHTFLADRDWMCAGRKDVNPEAIARYMIQNAMPLRKVGGRLIHFSRSCTRPEVEESAPVSDSFRLEAPEGSTTVDERSETTMYSSFSFVSYLMPALRVKNRKRKLRGRTP